ncbi:unnamed protein product, partial [Brachionus calyciflorus]
MKLRVIIFLSIFTQGYLASADSNDSIKCSEFDRLTKYQFTSDNDFYLIMSSFDSFSKINFNCINLKYSFRLIHLIFNPVIPIFYKNLNFNIDKYASNETHLDIYLVNLDGFILDQNVLYNLEGKYKTFKYQLFYSKLKFLDTKTSINSCSKKENYKIFQSVDDLLFSFTTKYYLNTCPFIFHNTKVNEVSFYGLTKSIIKNNMLSFIDLNEDTNSSVKTILATYFNGKLNRSFLSPRIFRGLTQLTISGKLSEIDEYVLMDLENLSVLYFDLNNIYNLLSRSSKWISNLNKKNSQKEFKLYFQLYEDYSFPNEDFCLFIIFPKNRNIIPKFRLWKRNCSCTIFWMIENISNYSDQNGNQCQNYKQIKECKFTELINKCSKSNLKSSKYFPNSIDYLYASQLVFSLTIFMTPFIGFFSLITNSLSFLILIKKDDSKSKQNLNKSHNNLNSLMLLCSILNLLYTLIHLFHLINACTSYSGIFCSVFNRDILVQYYDIIFFQFLGSIFKSLSNVINMSISLNRYCLLEKTKLISKCVAIMKKKLFIIGILIFYVGGNIDKFFTNQINIENIYASDYNFYDEFPIKNNLVLVSSSDMSYATQRIL